MRTTALAVLTLALALEETPMESTAAQHHAGAGAPTPAAVLDVTR